LLARLEAKIDVNQTKTDEDQERMGINLKEMGEEIKSGQAEMKSTVNAFPEKMDASIANRMDDLECEEPISADMKTCQETTPCHKAREADTEKTEPDPGMMQSIEEHQEISKGDPKVMPVGGLRKRHRDRNLAMGLHQKPKERIWGYCGSRKRVTIASRRNMSRHARVAW
jgi:hypothetical protein